MKKRLLSMLLALVMVIGLLPTSALAMGYHPGPNWNGKPGENPDQTEPAPTPGSDAGKSIIAVIKQGTPNDNEYVGAYNKIKVRLEDTDYNSLALKTGAQSEITFNATEIDPDNIASTMSAYIPEGYYYVGAFFYWNGQPAEHEDYQTGNPKYVGKFVNKGNISRNHPDYYSYLGFTTTSSDSGDDWNDRSNLYAYNPTGTLHLVYAKLSEEIGDTVDNVWVKLNCETNTSHTKGYDLLDGSFTLGPVSTSGSTRTRTMTINAAKYLEAFNKVYSGHTLVSSGSTTITLVYDSTKQVWKPQNSNDVPDVPVVFNVKCEAASYNLSYSWNLPTGASETLPTGGSYYAGDAVTLDTKYVKGSTTKVGHDTYTFSGWTASPALVDGKMPESNVTVSGTWEKTGSDSQYNLSYSWNLPTGASETLPTGGSYYAGDAVTLDTKYVKGSTTKVGHDTYTFSGWTASPALVDGKMPESNVTVSGTWEKTGSDAQYTLSYNWNLPEGATEKIPDSKQYYEGNPVTLDTTYKAGTTITVGSDNYVFTGWVPDSDLTKGMPAKAVVVSGEWKLDNWKDNGNVTDSETGGDGVPDEHQALVKFAAKENGTVSGTGTVQVFTMDMTNDGTYKKSKTVTPSLTNVTTTPASGYAFDIWTKDTGNEGVNPETPITVTAGSTTIFYANFAEDTNGGEGGDGTPDKYQAKVTYKVVNGTWDGTNHADKTQWFPLSRYEGGVWTPVTSTLGTSIPTGMKPDSSHTEAGAWDKAIDITTPVTENAVYTYTFGTIKSFNITVSVTNGTANPAESPISVQYNGSQTISFSANEGFALDTVTVDGDPAVLTDDSYTFENVTANHTIAVVYAEDTKGGETPDSGDGIPDKYQAEVTYKVVNGTWSDGKTADLSYWFTLYDYDNGVWTATSPAPTLVDTIPTGMKPNDGYAEGGKWSFPELSGETVVTGTVTYTYTFLPIGGTSFNPNDIYGEDDGSETAALVSKTLSGSLPFGFRETFSVTLTNKEDADEVYTGYASMSGTGTLPFVFDQAITFSQPGQYVYTVAEARGSTTYIKYDTASYTLIVWVDYAEQESGDTVRQLEVKGWQFSGEDEAQQLTITNTASYVAVIVPPADPAPTINVKGLDTVNHVAYIVGRDTGLVDPNGTITRAEVATIYFRLMTEEWRDLYWDDTNSYSDVDGDDWYNVAISTLEKAGVIKDTRTGGAFRPNDPITRAELAVMAAQFCTVTGKIPAVSFLDVPATHWAYDEIALIEYAGWIEGFEGYFRPDDNLSRAECVTIVNRMLNRGVEPEDMLANMVVFPDNLNVNAWYYAAIQEAANSHTYTRTGKKLTGEIFYGEQWLVLLPATDWAALEQAWANTYRA